jgi:hypothetical protein
VFDPNCSGTLKRRISIFREASPARGIHEVSVRAWHLLLCGNLPCGILLFQELYTFLEPGRDPVPLVR